MDYKQLAKLTKNELFGRYDYLGQGTSRTVFDLGNGLVLKRAKINSKGTAQNETESALYKIADPRIKPLLCPLVFSDQRTVIMKKAIPLSKASQIPDEKRLEVRKFKRLLQKIEDVFVFQNGDQFWRRNKVTDEEEIQIKNSPFYEKLLILNEEYDLSFGDLVRPSTWGYLDGQFVIIDYGCTKTVYDEFYRVAF